jgi:hypothetical protein
MTIQWIDGFDWWGSNPSTITVQFDRLYTGTSITGIGSSYGRRAGSNGARIQGDEYLLRTGTSPFTVGYFGVAFRLDSLDAEKSFMYFNNSFYSLPMAIITVDIYGRLRMYNCDNGGPYTVLGYSPPNMILPNIWYYIEWKYTVTSSTSTGDCQVLLNGQDVFALSDGSPVGSGVDTRNQGNTSITNMDGAGLTGGVFRGGTGAYFDFDDWYIIDDTGVTNTTYLGDIRVDPIVPTGNGDLNQWLGQDSIPANNWTQVNALPCDEGTTYIADNNAGDINLFHFGALPATPTVSGIRGVQVSATAEKTMNNYQQFQQTVKSGGTLYPQTSVYLTAGYQTFHSLYEVDPNTSLLWTTTSLGNAQFGVENP